MSKNKQDDELFIAMPTTPEFDAFPEDVIASLTGKSPAAKPRSSEAEGKEKAEASEHIHTQGAAPKDAGRPEEEQAGPTGEPDIEEMETADAPPLADTRKDEAPLPDAEAAVSDSSVPTEEEAGQIDSAEQDAADNDASTASLDQDVSESASSLEKEPDVAEEQPAAAEEAAAVFEGETGAVAEEASADEEQPVAEESASPEQEETPSDAGKAVEEDAEEDHALSAAPTAAAALAQSEEDSELLEEILPQRTLRNIAQFTTLVFAGLIIGIALFAPWQNIWAHILLSGSSAMNGVELTWERIEDATPFGATLVKARAKTPKTALQADRLDISFGVLSPPVSMKLHTGKQALDIGIGYGSSLEMSGSVDLAALLPANAVSGIIRLEADLEFPRWGAFPDHGTLSAKTGGASSSGIAIEGLSLEASVENDTVAINGFNLKKPAEITAAGTVSLVRDKLAQSSYNISGSATLAGAQRQFTRQGRLEDLKGALSGDFSALMQ